TGGTADRNRSHWSTSKTPSYTKSVSWQHHPGIDTYSTIVIIKSNLTFEITKICRVLCRYSIAFLALPLQAFNQ
ncbi:hypothetical protein AB8Q57_29505, partial [Klebsiella pneumoniae]